MGRGRLIIGVTISLFTVLMLVFSVQAMDNLPFYELVYKLGELSSDYPKIALIKNNTQNEALTADQIALLLEYIKSGDERLYLLEELIPFIDDPENSIVILYSFKEIPFRNQAITILKQLPNQPQESGGSNNSEAGGGTSDTTTTTNVDNSSNAENNVVININMSSENQSTNGTTSTEGQVENAKAPMASEKFQALLQQLESKYYDEEKIDLLELAIPNKFFSSWQVTMLLKTIDYSSSQLEALRMLVFHVSDPENKHTIIDVFYYSSDKKEAKDILMNI